jgi:hypothetical protein
MMDNGKMESGNSSMGIAAATGRDRTLSLVFYVQAYINTAFT